MDNKLLVTLITIEMKTHSPATFTFKEVNHLLDYVATYAEDGMLSRASNMQLSAHSDAGYLNEEIFRSRASDHMCLS